MSNKKIKVKEARFTLEPDGFSIHTFELSRQLTKREYHAVKDTLYRQSEYDDKGLMYKDRNSGKHICTLYSEYGIRIELAHKSHDDTDSCFVRMLVNPRKLIEPGASYLGILPPVKESVSRVAEAFAELFHGTALESDINAYKLRRMDLCANVRCDNGKLFREMVRALRKLPTPPKYERRFYKHKDKKKTNRYNKHYLRFHCGTHELVIYDKTYQMRENGLAVAYEKLPEGVLRFEIHCEREYLRRIEKESGKPGTRELLWQLIQGSEERLISHFSRCFPDASFVRKEELDAFIKTSRYREVTKEAMLELAKRLQRIQSVDKALKEMKKDGYHTDELLDKFAKLKISPIPLRKNFCAKWMPGPVELLKGISDGSIEVEYIKIKYK